MENYKRRIERTYAEQSRRERKDLLLRFLNVLDNLERALSYQSASGGEADVKALITGLRLTEGQFRDLLTSAGVTEVPAVGEAFDPARHEAVATAETQERRRGRSWRSCRRATSTARSSCARPGSRSPPGPRAGRLRSLHRDRGH